MVPSLAAMSVAGQFTIPPDHPALPGHFPGHPIVPGAVLLDFAAALIGQASAGLRLAAIRQVKFVAPVLPGQAVDVHYQRGDGAVVSFVGLHGKQRVFTGSFVMIADSAVSAE